ncbi:hypothetical protein C8R43DRAFT_567582 [Mycena crocata]|nr:hypothetical protein C8R43DRAFT_567582 [Mycena crocata]
MWLNRFADFMILPIWISVLVFSTIPSWSFQQSACDKVVAPHTIRLVLLPFLAFFSEYPTIGAALIVAFLCFWGIGIYLQRREIWKKHNKIFPWRRMWRDVVDN